MTECRSDLSDLVLLRGLMRTKKHWGDFPAEVQRSLPHLRVRCIELPGVGEESRVRPPFNLTQTAQFIHSKVLSQASGGRIGLLGVSLGGMIALELMGLYPESYTKSMIINASSALSPMVKRLRWQVWKEVLSAALDTNKMRREHKLVPRLVNSAQGQKNMGESWEKMAKDFKFHPLAPVAQLRAASGFIPAEVLNESKEILLIRSLGDLFVDPSCSVLLSKHFSWAIKSHPWAGHDLAWDDPVWLLKELQSFFP